MKKLFVLAGALLFSMGFIFAQDNVSTVTVSGNNNDALADQLGTENVAEISQDGNVNTALIQQGDFGGDNVQSNFAEAKIEQVGNNNDATIKQRQGWSGGSAVSVHEVKQVGNKNEASLVTFNGGNSGEVYQEGNMNYARGQQSSGPDDVIEITQKGNDNSADVNQLVAVNSEAKVYQDGNQNVATIMQAGWEDNKASQWVSGDNNNVFQLQDGIANHQRVELTGNGNDYDVVQEGYHNKLYVNSRGTGPGDNTSHAYSSVFYAEQLGDNNIASGSMGGNNNTLTIHQYGNDNMITGGAGYWDAAGFTIDGNNNVGTIFQHTDGNSAILNVVGDGNTAGVLQD